jgi:hypothetical protein
MHVTNGIPLGCPLPLTVHTIHSVQILKANYKAIAKFSAVGEGGFLETCIEHVAAQGPSFDKFTIDGVKEVDAFIKWWKSDGMVLGVSAERCARGYYRITHLLLDS